MKQNEARFCVFCGNAPRDNNPEHVLPTWLLKLTGDPKRTVSLGWDYQQNMARKFAFSSFVFPACKVCNEEYSKLETAAGRILTKLCNDSAINVMDADIILDWFDKVRIGLWLGFHILDRNIFGIDPMFHIENRVARKDRMLFVTHFIDQKKKLTFLGTDSAVFRFMPSCFGLLVNGTLFVNASFDFMIAARAGFPYPKEASVDADTMLLSANCWDIANKVKIPVIRFPFLP
ncbi:MAG: hypothetical protein H0W13_07880 [Nitrospirales bacterium]|nr:hypothetical protein [Nitrospirales bacterium]